MITSLLDTIEAQREKLERPAKNNFKRWPVLGERLDWVHVKTYNNYNEAVDSLKTWIDSRINWINSNLTRN